MHGGVIAAARGLNLERVFGRHRSPRMYSAVSFRILTSYQQRHGDVLVRYLTRVGVGSRALWCMLSALRWYARTD